MTAWTERQGVQGPEILNFCLLSKFSADVALLISPRGFIRINIVYIDCIYSNKPPEA